MGDATRLRACYHRGSIADRRAAQAVERAIGKIASIFRDAVRKRKENTCDEKHYVRFTISLSDTRAV